MKDTKDQNDTAMPLTALVVDDNQDLANTMCLLLQRKGLQAHKAYTGRDALALLARMRPNVVFLDIGLPDQSGYDVCKQLRQTAGGAQAYVVAVTGHDDPDDVMKAANSGFDRHVAKPMSLATLQEILHAVRIRSAFPGAAPAADPRPFR